MFHSGLGGNSLLPLELGWLVVERPRLVMNCRNLSAREDVNRLEVGIDVL